MEEKLDCNELQMLSQRMNIVRPILFTGAGFSYGAINGNNDPLPLGSELKDILLTKFIGYRKESTEYIELHNQSLSDVYEYCENYFTPEKSADFLKELFSDVPQRPIIRLLLIIIGKKYIRSILMTLWKIHLNEENS